MRALTLSMDAFLTPARREPGLRTGLGKEHQPQGAASKAPSRQAEGVETQSWAWTLAEAAVLKQVHQWFSPGTHHTPEPSLSPKFSSCKMAFSYLSPHALHWLRGIRERFVEETMSRTERRKQTRASGRAGARSSGQKLLEPWPLLSLPGQP